MKFSKSHILIFVGSFVLTTCVVWFLLPAKKDKGNMYFTQGYNFRQLRLNNPDVMTLSIGDKIDISNIKSSDAKLLSSFSSKNLFLLVVIDPNCPACNESKDMMNEIHKTAETIGIPYFPIAANNSYSRLEMGNYSRNFGFENYFYQFAELSSPDSLSQMVTPSHILVDRNGIVLNIWLGSNKDEIIRKRMSDQISSDLLTTNDTYQTISNN